MSINEQELKARIEYARNLAGFNKQELAKLIDMPVSTFQRKMNNPLTMSLEEFYKLNDALGNDVIAEYLSEELHLKMIRKIKSRKLN